MLPILSASGVKTSGRPAPGKTAPSNTRQPLKSPAFHPAPASHKREAQRCLRPASSPALLRTPPRNAIISPAIPASGETAGNCGGQALPCLREAGENPARCRRRQAPERACLPAQSHCPSGGGKAGPFRGPCGAMASAGRPAPECSACALRVTGGGGYRASALCGLHSARGAAFVFHGKNGPRRFVALRLFFRAPGLFGQGHQKTRRNPT